MRPPERLQMTKEMEKWFETGTYEPPVVDEKQAVRHPICYGFQFTIFSSTSIFFVITLFKTFSRKLSID